MSSDENLPKPKFPLPWPRPTLDPGGPAAPALDLPLARYPGWGEPSAENEEEPQRPPRRVTGRFPKPGPRLGDQSMSHQEQLDDTQPGLLRKPSWR